MNTRLVSLPRPGYCYKFAFSVIYCMVGFSLVPRLLCMGGEKRAWYTLFVYAQFPQDFWEFGNFLKICSVTLTSTRQANFCHIYKDACH